MRKCARCGKKRFLRTTKNHALKVAGRTFKATVPALRCRACKEIVVDADAISAVELAAAVSLVNAGRVNGEVFRFMRHALDLTSTHLAHEFGVALETVSRWEHGGQAVDRMSWLTLAAMVADRLEHRTTTVDRLRAIRERPRLARTVRLGG